MSTITRNTRGGKNYKKMKSGNVRRKSKNPNTPVDTTTGVDHYAVVSKRLGDNRIMVKLDTGIEVQAVIPGRFRRKVWFNAGDFIQVQCAGDDYYDVIQKIVNENELVKAQTAIRKKENTTDDVFMPNIEEEDDDEEESEQESDEDFDAFGNKIEKTEELSNEKDEDVKLEKASVNVDKFKRKQKEKERDVSRRNNTRDYDLKPDSIVERSGFGSNSDSDSD